MRKSPLAAFLALTCASCVTVGPDYKGPDVPWTPARFVNAADAGAAPIAQESLYWAAFDDPMLTHLVSQAVTANHDIRIAVASLREARGLRGEIRGDLFPQVDVDASVLRERLSSVQLPGASMSERSFTNFNAGFDAAWELDLFGGIRRSLEAATAQEQASAADLAAVRISVASETARQYFRLRGLKVRLRVAQDNLKNQSDTLGNITKRFDVGRVTDFDVSRSRELVETTRSTIPVLQAEIARTTYALAVLVGNSPENLAIPMDDTEILKTTPPVFVLSDPAALLRTRPDVAAAERRVAAATASIGVNTAELFPSVTIIGAVGLNATTVGTLGKGNAVRYAAGPSLRWSLLDFGRIRARIEQANARYDGALASYQKTVLVALQDAEGALTTVGRTTEQAESVEAAMNAARSASDLATLRYKAGATDLLDLLDAQRRVLASEDRYVQVTTDRAIASIALFKAMGGNWDGGIAVGSTTTAFR